MIRITFWAFFITFFLVILLFVGFKKGSSGLKLMLLGINITLFGGIIAVDPNSSLGGVEYIIAFLGLVLSFIGFGKNETNNIN